MIHSAKKFKTIITIQTQDKFLTYLSLWAFRIPAEKATTKRTDTRVAPNSKDIICLVNMKTLWNITCSILKFHHKKQATATVAVRVIIQYFIIVLTETTYRFLNVHRTLTVLGNSIGNRYFARSFAPVKWCRKYSCNPNQFSATWIYQISSTSHCEI